MMLRSRFLAALGILPAARGVATAASGAVRIIVLGDSLALATGASRADGGFIFPAYRDFVRDHPGSTLDNVAIGGSTAADVLRLQAGRVRASTPDVVIVCVGGNDVVRRTSAEAFARTYQQLLAAIRSEAPRARIICCGVPNVAISPIFADERILVAALSAEDDAAVRQASHAARARFVDFYAVTDRQSGSHDRFFSRDRFHPSDAGYALLRAALEPELIAAAR